MARIKQEQQRHTNQTSNTNSSLIKRRRGRPAKREQLHDNDEDWHVEDEEDYSTGTPLDVTLSSEGNPSVYEFRFVISNDLSSSIDFIFLVKHQIKRI